MDVTLATCLELPEADPDQATLSRALEEAGVASRVCAWDDPAVDWAASRLCVIRSTWDYIHRADDFCAWADRVARASVLKNPADVVRWNAHKRYLLDLAARGLAVVPTELVARGGGARWGELASRWGEVVVKPAVSAGSFGTRRARGAGDEGGARHFRELAATRDVLVQPYVRSVEGYGERALVWIDGEFTHAVRKSPRFDGDAESVSDAVDVADDERELGARALASVGAERLLYARVDVARGDDDGAPMVMELELIEPSLFLRQSPRALARLVAAIAREAARAG